MTFFLTENELSTLWYYIHVRCTVCHLSQPVCRSTEFVSSRQFSY